jgi:hypothetical protein
MSVLRFYFHTRVLQLQKQLPLVVHIFMQRPALCELFHTRGIDDGREGQSVDTCFILDVSFSTTLEARLEDLGSVSWDFPAEILLRI